MMKIENKNNNIDIEEMINKKKEKDISDDVKKIMKHNSSKSNDILVNFE